MSFIQTPGRRVGLLYALVSIPGAFALAYVPSKLMVHGNAAATASNIAASETLFRLGIGCNLISQVLFIWVALALYDLFKSVNRRYASFMFGLLVIAVPIALLNELNAIAALILVRGAPYLSVFEKPQRDALAMLFLNLHSEGLGIAEIFWGLWLFPLALLVYRSGFFPRILALPLVLTCFSYVADSLSSYLLPQYADTISQWMAPLRLGELVFILWLLIVGARPMGAKPEPLTAPAS
jgi:Domain of unknown function (DUF4386)